jgi:hypothetical protein
LKLSDFLNKGKFKLDYGALWAYSPYGKSQQEQLSRSYKTAVKNDESIRIGGKEIPMSEVVAEVVRGSKGKLAFGQLFDGKSVLVPVTSSSLKAPDSLWVPLRLAKALHARGLGAMVSVALVRKYPIQKAATSKSENRPTVADHYNSQEVQKLISDPESIILVDDVVTRGSALVGSALKLAEVYPNARIAGFAAIRTVTLSRNFKAIDDPVFDQITLYESGKTHRDPD